MAIPPVSRSVFHFFFAVLVLLSATASEYHVVSGGANDLCPGSSGGRAPPSTCRINCFRADPVCGEDGVTYGCGCPEAECAGKRVVKLGPCEAGHSSGAGGQTFWLAFPFVQLLCLGMI